MRSGFGPLWKQMFDILENILGLSLELEEKIDEISMKCEARASSMVSLA